MMKLKEIIYKKKKLTSWKLLWKLCELWNVLLEKFVSDTFRAFITVVGGEMFITSLHLALGSKSS